MREAIDAGYEEFGEPANHTDSRTKECTPCAVVIDHNLQKWGDAVTVGNANAVISVRRSELCRRPRREDSFSLGDGTLLRVDQVLSQTRFEYQLLATEDDSRA